MKKLKHASVAVLKSMEKDVDQVSTHLGRAIEVVSYLPLTPNIFQDGLTPKDMKKARKDINKAINELADAYVMLGIIEAQFAANYDQIVADLKAERAAERALRSLK